MGDKRCLLAFLLMALLPGPASAASSSVTLDGRWAGFATDPCSGTPAIGDECSDGTFYVGDAGLGEVFAAPADSGFITWSSFPVDTYAFSSTDGRSNTQAILSAPTWAAPYPAAEACDSMTAGGFDDWYLPSRQELGLLLEVAGEIGMVSGMDSKLYWSSTEYDTDYAWEMKIAAYEGPSIGYEMAASKVGQLNVRCVRRN